MQAPWVERYRPKNLEEVALDSLNRHILKKAINLNKMPNMIFYGPPGTGKTTVAEILISYRRKKGKLKQGNILRLNASDQRGLVSVKQTLIPFIHSNSLLASSEKIVVLDEADYMTSAAHKALFKLIKTSRINVTYIIICNFLFRIDSNLKSCLIPLQFRAPEKAHVKLQIQKILEIEKSSNSIPLERIIKLYYPDVRSIINACQGQSPNEHRKSMTTLISRIADELQTSPMRIVSKLIERNLEACTTNEKCQQLLQSYCKFLALSGVDTLKAIDYFETFVNPNLDDSLDE